MFGFIWQFLRAQKGTFFTVFVLDCLTWPLDTLLWPYILAQVIDIFTRYDTNRMNALEPLKPIILAAFLLVLFVEISSRVMGFLMARALPKVQADIRMRMFDHVQRHSPHYFNERFAGSLANKITDMTTQVESIIFQFFWPLLPAFSACILGLVFLWFINPIFSWILLTWFIVHLAISLKFSWSIDEYENIHGEVRSTLLGKIVDSFTNNYAVNLFTRFKYEREALSPFQKEEETANVTARRYVEKMRIVMSIFYILAVVVGIFGTMIYLWLQGQISTGQVVQVFTTMWGIAMIFWTIGIALPALFQSVGVARAAYTVMQDPEDLGDKPQAKDLKVTAGEIIFDNVSFQYGDKALFKNKNVKIKGGEKVGLVGFTGAGKSTFISLILRFFPIKEGKILIDGQEVAEVTLESLRKQIALIPQEPLLFHRTLRENIAYGNPAASESAILGAARLAHADEFIINIPKGYDAKVGERGTKLSGGEKQRIAIARAILSEAPILILDEATSSLDSVTEKYIQDSLEKLMEGRTTIVIAHRLSTLSRMDRILVFDQGRIVEEGTHSELLRKNGLYAKMWNMQVGGFLPF